MAGIREEKTKLVQKTQKGHFWTFLFPQKLCTRMKRFFTVILHHIREPCLQIYQTSMAGI